MRYIRDMRSISTVYLPKQIPRKVSVISYILESQKKKVSLTLHPYTRAVRELQLHQYFLSPIFLLYAIASIYKQ